jgi:hypothetical protein
MRTCLLVCGLILVAMGLGALPLAAGGEDAAPPLTDVKKTVDTFAGHWVLTGTDSEPGVKAPVPVKAVIDCKLAALGAAVNCLVGADVSGSHIEAATVIGYSPDEHVVRWMEISSTGEYHDHRGTWRGNEIQFAPLTYIRDGAKMTEYLTTVFPSSGKMILKSVTRMSDGVSRLELTGTRGAP